MLTVDEVEALLLGHRLGWQLDIERDTEDSVETDWDDWDDAIPWRSRLTTEVVGLGTVEVWLHDFGGIETNVSYLMFQVGDQIFRKEGLWVSHDGQYWDGDFTEVRAVQKVITDYEEL